MVSKEDPVRKLTFGDDLAAVVSLYLLLLARFFHAVTKIRVSDWPLEIKKGVSAKSFRYAQFGLPYLMLNRKRKNL
ncbi:unnamed protein product [Lathyrus oleraceus]